MSDKKKKKNVRVVRSGKEIGICNILFMLFLCWVMVKQ